MKYLDYAVTFTEFPDEIALCIDITNCPFHCKGCHSPELWEDVGTILNQNELAKLIGRNKGISCVGFMGGKPKLINTFAAFIKNSFKDIKVGWYWGGKDIPREINIKWFDYIKIGPYVEELGGLDNPNTNQRFYAKGSTLHKLDANDNMLYDVTYKFWKNEKKNR